MRARQAVQAGGRPSATRLIAFALAIAIALPTMPDATGRDTVQRGRKNYAGPSCPGRSWTCTTDTRNVVQAGAVNVFECTGSICRVSQTASPGGRNDARCVQSRRSAQSCDISQTNAAGPNTITIDQRITLAAKKRSVAQSSRQLVITQQSNLTGANALSVVQSTSHSATSKRRGRTQSHTQEATGTVRAEQRSASGAQTSAVAQAQDLRSQASSARSTAQRQNAIDDGPDLLASITQHTGSGRNELTLSQRQRLIQSTSAAQAQQVQGAETSGEDFVGDIDSDGSAGGSSNVVVTQAKEWIQEAPAGTAQTQIDKVRIRPIPLTLTPDTVRGRQDTVLRSGPGSQQRCLQEAEVHARVNGVVESTCTIDDGTGTLQTSQVHREGTDFVLRNEIPRPAAAVHGSVTDARTGLPITSAVVSVGNIGTQTAQDGTYALAGITPGNHIVFVSASGYATTTRAIDLAPGEDERQDFSLVAQGP